MSDKTLWPEFLAGLGVTPQGHLRPAPELGGCGGLAAERLSVPGASQPSLTDIRAPLSDLRFFPLLCSICLASASASTPVALSSLKAFPVISTGSMQ